ncbi:hypothetical protein EBU95_21290 [bacterium]|nr:hypothetical protein [bacterium]
MKHIFDGVIATVPKHEWDKWYNTEKQVIRLSVHDEYELSYPDAIQRYDAFLDECDRAVTETSTQAFVDFFINYINESNVSEACYKEFLETTESTEYRASLHNLNQEY